VDGHNLIDRRVFLAGMAATAVLAACGLPPLPPDLDPNLVVDKDTMMGWIQQIVSQGIRRPGYPADVWAQSFIFDRFCDFGLQNVRLEPVPVPHLTFDSYSLEATPQGGTTRVLECFPLPYTQPVTDLELELVPYSDIGITGKAALVDYEILRVPNPALLATLGNPGDMTGRVYDPDNTFLTDVHVLPFPINILAPIDNTVANGAAAFIGSLKNYPGDRFEYFVPYDNISRPIPGLWIKGSDGQWLHEQLLLGSVNVKINLATTIETVESYNVVGELPGADDEIVMIGSHHDSGWTGAVEDGSGISMVLAQAKFWSQVPEARRPHKLLFVLQGGHMAGGAGLHKFIEDHEDELDQIVLEVHLEHAAKELNENDPNLAPTGLCVPRWFFTSKNPQLETAVKSAIQTEDLRRSMLMTPTSLGPQPPTDGAFYYNHGVPVAQFLAAPFYLFDSIDTIDKVDQDNLVALSRATIRIVDSTTGVSAAEMRAGVVP
jgi:hypothetical protein